MRTGVVVLVVVVVAVVVGIVQRVRLDEKKLRMFGIQQTRLKLGKYVDNAYPAWASAHPNKACPDSINDLSKYVTSGGLTFADGKDDWDRPLKMLCGASLPPGAVGIGLLSSGEDGEEGTEDDIKSWK